MTAKPVIGWPRSPCNKVENLPELLTLPPFGVPLGATPDEVAITPDGASVYVGHANTVSVISTATNTVVANVPVGNFPQYIAFGTQDPVASLLGQIQALVTAGTLTQNQGNALINKLDQVIAKLDQGQTTAACNQLGAFINQVNAFINNGSLTQAQGQTSKNYAKIGLPPAVANKLGRRFTMNF